MSTNITQKPAGKVAGATGAANASKTIVITGCSTGFGALTAKALAANGHHVIATMRNAATRNRAAKLELEAFAKHGDYKLEVVELDVTNDASVEVAIASIIKSHGRIDVLVNNAGVMNVGITEAYTIDELKTQFEVNTFGPARTIRAVLPTMRSQGSGLIVSVTSLAGRLVFRQGRIKDAIPYYEKATAVMETAFHDPGMLITCCDSIHDVEGARRAAQLTVARAEKAVARDQTNGSAMGYFVVGLASTGQGHRAKEWINRALMIDPGNLIMRYNFSCALATKLHDGDAALALLDPYFASATLPEVKHAEVDPDMDQIRSDPRFSAMLAAAKARIAGSS